MAPPVMFNPFTPEFIEDPYPHYAELRVADPVHAHPLGVWFLWRYADADALARSGLSVDERTFPTSPLTPLYRELSGGKLPRGDGLALMDRDPPDHTRLRSLLTRTFTMRQIERRRAATSAATWIRSRSVSGGLRCMPAHPRAPAPKPSARRPHAR